MQNHVQMRTNYTHRSDDGLALVRLAFHSGFALVTLLGPVVIQADEILTRFGQAAESAQKLAEDAAKAEAVLGIHGVSVTARTPKRPAPSALRSIVEKHFRVHNTGNDPLHRTIELPKPVTPEVAELFNRLFGRI